jgi:hypothetical protein
MLWVLAIVILLLVVFVFIPAVRAIVLGLVVSAVVLGLIWYWFSGGQEQTSKNKIRLSEVEFTNLRLDSKRHTLMGQIKNNSQRYTLAGIGIKITMQDCEPQGTDGKTKCETVGEAAEQLNLDIPPKQVRDIDAYVSLPSNMRVLSSPSWSYSVQYIEGK